MNVKTFIQEKKGTGKKKTIASIYILWIYLKYLPGLYSRAPKSSQDRRLREGRAQGKIESKWKQYRVKIETKNYQIFFFFFFEDFNFIYYKSIYTFFREFCIIIKGNRYRHIIVLPLVVLLGTSKWLIFVQEKMWL